MARKIYKARDRLVRKRVRGALVEENVRTKKRKRVGKTEAEQELVREGSAGSDRAENGSNNSHRLSRLSALPDAKKRLQHCTEEAGSLKTSEGMILDIDETDSAFAGDDLRPAEKRQRLKVGERHRDQERRDADANEEASMEDVTVADHGTSPPDPVNLKKQRQRKQAETFRQVEKDAEEAAESFEEITGAEIQRTSDLASSRRASRLNHSDEGSGMVHGAGRLVKKGVALASAPAVQAAKRSVSDAGEDNTAVQAAAGGATIAHRTARYSAYHHSTNHASKRDANVHESALRSGEGIRSESIKATEHAAQTEHKKKEQIRAFQKKKRQCAIAEAKRRETSIVTAGGFADSVNSMFTAPKKAKEAAKSFFSEHKGTIIGVCVAGIIFALSALALSSGASLVHGSGTSVISTTYVSTDEDIYASENAYCALEDGLNGQVNALQSTHPGYDEYECQIDEIEHNPYYLISYLQVKYGGFTYDDGIKAEINRLFRQQYTLSVSEKSEMRTRMETVAEMRPITDPDTGEVRMEPYEYEQEVEYEYRTLYAVLTNRNFDMIARANMTEEELVLYNALNRTYGNRPYLFDLNSLPGVGSAGIQFEIPPEALSDEKFMNMIREAEKYLGMTYVWGGKSPRTGFDCSGFVCWVLNHCGNGWDVGSKRAKELCRMCIYVSPEEARPGDLIFFEKTYDTDGASHVGIYVGNNTMIHCGNPIKYGRIDTRYFKQHFLCFGRLPFYDN